MKTRKLNPLFIGLAGAALFIFGSVIYAQDHQEISSAHIAEKNEIAVNEVPVAETIRYAILTNATPKNGWCYFRDNLAKNVQYPDYMKQLGIEETINVQFVVTGEGKIDNVRTVVNNSSRAGEGHINSLKEEARRAVIASFGEWIPSKLDGDPVVSSTFDVPLTFKVNNLTNR